MRHNDDERAQMIVYRFEKNGIGPYINNSGVIISILSAGKTTRSEKKYQKLSSGYSLNHENYLKAHKSSQYIYGCSSKEQLRVYFNGKFKDLFKHGFRIKRYKVPDKDVIDIGNQVAFPVKYHKLQSVNGIIRKKKPPRII